MLACGAMKMGPSTLLDQIIRIVVLVTVLVAGKLGVECGFTRVMGKLLPLGALIATRGYAYWSCSDIHFVNVSPNSNECNCWLNQADGMVRN